MRIHLNSNAAARDLPAPAWIDPHLSLRRAELARREMQAWPGYAPTPLVRLSGLADALGLGAIWFKDEGSRFGLGSFKALGGAYAAGLAILRRLRELGLASPATTLDEIRAGRFAGVVSGLTLATATDGNHGKSVAWGARMYGARSRIYLHRNVNAVREAAIRDLGAEIVRVPGNYDDSVRAARADADENGFLIISDTSYDGYVETPADVMQGYTLMLDEALADPAVRPTHVFVQAGVGALAAAVAGHLWQRLGPGRPRVIVVEAEAANCLYRSAEAGRAVVVEGDHPTIMAGLACGEVSMLAWQILETAADAFVTVADSDAKAAMRRLYRPSGSDPSIVAGESGAAGLAGLLAAAGSEAAREQLALDRDAAILLIGTEADSDPDSFDRIVGRERPQAAE
ncbi:diaminopropionate ammonia-lyase [Sphingomonas sp. URHD0057]|uniref:diaminopropionate ammonia-lyase n=1 Tax=Sphingomonas sp. URHD0057 TaxID=1380389 RepID=UPI0012DECC3C|nr:diaminopropionate ammonia-lyase [Sphingomonas sp. URHD0057]